MKTLLCSFVIVLTGCASLQGNGMYSSPVSGKELKIVDRVDLSSFNGRQCKPLSKLPDNPSASDVLSVHEVDVLANKECRNLAEESLKLLRDLQAAGRI